MHAAVHVRVRTGLVVLDRAHHSQGHLSGGRAVEIDERLVVNGACEKRKIAPHALGIEHGSADITGGGRHQINSFKASDSRIWPARLCSIWRRSSGTAMRATTSSRKAHCSSCRAVAGSMPRESR